MYPYPPMPQTIWHHPAVLALNVVLLAGIMTLIVVDDRWHGLRRWMIAAQAGIHLGVVALIFVFAVMETRQSHYVAGFGWFVAFIWTCGIAIAVAIHRMQVPVFASGGIGGGLLLLATACSIPFLYEARKSQPIEWSRVRFMEIGLAISSRLDQVKHPLHAWRDDQGRNVSWRVQLLPYLSSSLRPYDPRRPWNGPANGDAATYAPQAFAAPCQPRRQDAQGREYTSVALVTGPGTAFPNGQLLKNVPDATIIAGEADGLNIVWTEPRDIDTARQAISINLPGKTPGWSDGTFSSSWSPDGVHVLRQDGGVEFLSRDLDPKVLKSRLAPATAK
jgi:hypothetical protein